jgi:hypothetical protein
MVEGEAISVEGMDIEGVVVERGWVFEAKGAVDEDDDAAAARRDDETGEEATGCFFLAVDSEGESTNIIEGPVAVSSAATAVCGVGFDVNLGSDWCLMGGGRISSVRGEEDSRCFEEPVVAASVRFEIVRIAVSEDTAFEWGFSGVAESLVGLFSC